MGKIADNIDGMYFRERVTCMDFNRIRPASGPDQIAYGFITHRAGRLNNVSTPAQTEAPQTETLSTKENESYGAGYPKASKSSDINELSLTFNREESFGYIGKDKDVAALDVQKAISDMQKDHILQQYHYFVGGRI